MMSKVIIVSCMLVFAGAKPSDLQSHGPYGVISAPSGYQPAGDYGAQPPTPQTYAGPILSTTDSSIYSSSNPDHPGDNQKGMPFEFSYNVNDPDTGNSHSHDSKSDGNTVKGSYKVLLPDGRTQVVNYEAGKDGYNAVVTYEGGASQGQSATSSGSGQSGFSNNVPAQLF